jgi:hypothetical protein
MKPAASTVTTAAAAVLSECWIWRESKTDDSGKCEKGSEKTEPAHNPYLPPNLELQFRTRSLSTKTARSHLIRF